MQGTCLVNGLVSSKKSYYKRENVSSQPDRPIAAWSSLPRCSLCQLFVPSLLSGDAAAPRNVFICRILYDVPAGDVISHRPGSLGTHPANSSTVWNSQFLDCRQGSGINSASFFSDDCAEPQSSYHFVYFAVLNRVLHSDH